MADPTVDVFKGDETKGLCDGVVEGVATSSSPRSRSAPLASAGMVALMVAGALVTGGVSGVADPRP